MNLATDPPDRLFAIVGRREGHFENLCPGPSAAGTCPQATGGPLPCAGARVVPLTGTGANGLPFSVPSDQRGPRCPLAWVDEAVTRSR
jgi:hypothetical protein